MEQRHLDSNLGLAGCAPETSPVSQATNEVTQSASHDLAEGLSDIRADFSSGEILTRADMSNGIWLMPMAEASRLRDAVRRPEFQIACIGDNEFPSEPTAAWDSLKEKIAEQIFLRREWYSGEVLGTAPLPSRVVRELRRSTGITAEVANEIHCSIERWIGAFSAATGSSRLKLILISERGPRRLELEHGGSPTSFHVDASGLRLVAPLLGPQTVFILAGKGEGEVRLVEQGEGVAPLLKSVPFDLDRAVRRSFERFVAPVSASQAGLIRRAPDRFGIVFSGTSSCVERPLTHAAPHPRDGVESIGWARLFMTVEPA